MDYLMEPVFASADESAYVAECMEKSEEWCPARPYSDSWYTWWDMNRIVEIRNLNKNLPKDDVYKLDSYSNADIEELCYTYVDTYKDKHGIKPRWIDFSKVSLKQIVSMLNDLEREPWMY